MLDVNLLVQVIGAVLTIVMSAAALYKAAKTTPADIASTYQRIAGEAADREERLRKRIEALESEIAVIKQERSARENELNGQIQELTRQLAAEKALNVQLRDELTKAQSDLSRLGVEVLKLKKSTGDLSDKPGATQ